MSAYRFCRTDDIPLLVDALNRCWRPHFPDAPEMTVSRFKREIRDLQIWCSSCMVAFAGSDPIGVLTGAKRSGATLVHRIAIAPDHVRQGHGRHLLTSLSSKLSILGPPTIVAELPGTAGPAHDLFAACGFVRDASYTDFVRAPNPDHSRPDRDPTADHPGIPGMLVIPITIDDLLSNGLLAETDARICWERSVATLVARKDDMSGLAVATDERIEAYVLYTPQSSVESLSSPCDTRIVALRSEVVDPEGLRLRVLLSRAIAERLGPVTIGKLTANEVPPGVLQDLGFRCVGVHTRYVGTARAA